MTWRVSIGAGQDSIPNDIGLDAETVALATGALAFIREHTSDRVTISGDSVQHDGWPNPAIVVSIETMPSPPLIDQTGSDPEDIDEPSPDPTGGLERGEDPGDPDVHAGEPK